MLTLRRGLLALLATSMAVAAGCGSGGSSGSSSSSGSGGGGGTVDVYSSLPQQGANKDQITAMINGIRLALSEAKNQAGTVKIKYSSLDDSTAQAGNWDPGQVAQNARKAAQDSKAVAYIGEFNSGASAISIPILNQAGLAMISPSNTYVGLTTSEPGSEKGEPQKYYPSGKRTYMRIVPRDTIQSAALLSLMKSDSCQKVALANDKDTYGEGLSRLMLLQKAKAGVNIVSNDGIDKTAANFRSYASKLKGQGVDCFVFNGVVANGGVQLMKDVASALPNAKLYGPDGMCTSDFTNPAKKGITSAIGTKFQCSVATLDLPSYPGGQQFKKAFNAKYGGSSPDPYSIYGYESMKLIIDTLKGLGDKATDKDAVLQALQATKDRDSVLGKYSFDKNGDTTLTDYGIYKVGANGDPTFEKTIAG